MNLSDDFHAMLTGHEDDASVHKQIASMVLSAPETPESNGLLALMYHEGIGVVTDCDRCFALAEKAASEGGDGLGCFLMGYMCAWWLLPTDRPMTGIAGAARGKLNRGAALPPSPASVSRNRTRRLRNLDYILPGFGNEAYLG